MSDKVQLRDPRATKVIELPSFPKSQVEIYPSILVKDTEGVDFGVLQDTSKNIKEGIKFLTKIIKSWNFTNDKDEILPITDEHISVLPMPDIDHIFKEFKAFSEEQKKSSTT